jgi:hypothetical protein
MGSPAGNQPIETKNTRHKEVSLLLGDCAHSLCNRVWAGFWSYDGQRENMPGAPRHSGCTLSPVEDLGRSLSISYSSNAPENAIP